MKALEGIPHFLESKRIASARRSHCAMVAKSLSPVAK
jgi:hypothetical protein